MNKMNQKDKGILLDFLKGHKLMSLGTYYKEPWAASVYYLFNDKFNLYFLSPTGSLHCKNIAKNPKVSITIADSGQKASDKKCGFQARGTAKKVGAVKEVKNLVTAWNRRHLDAPPINYGTMMKLWQSRFYKITISHIKFFNEVLYKKREVKSWQL